MTPNANTDDKVKKFQINSQDNVCLLVFYLKRYAMISTMISTIEEDDSMSLDRCATAS